MNTTSWTVAPTGRLVDGGLGMCPVGESGPRIGVHLGSAPGFGTSVIPNVNRFYGTTLGIPSSRRPSS